jgi:HEAT repeat protein
MAENGSLTAESLSLQGDDRLFTAIVSGCHVENAATLAGISQRTAYRRLSDPKFRAQVRQAREDLRESILARLADAGHDAIDTLWRLLDSEDENIRFKAAKALLDALASRTPCDQDVPTGKRLRAAVVLESD